MPSEKRRTTGARFYYRAKRTGGRVVKDYCGSLADPVVSFLARRDRLSKAEQQARYEADAEERCAYDAIEVYLIALERQLHQVLQTWIRRPTGRRPQPGHSRCLKQGVRAMGNTQRRQPLTRDEFDELVKRAETGDADALSELRTLMRADAATWRRFGDLTEHVKLAFLGLMVQGNVVARESLTVQLEELTRELRQGNQSPIRKLLVDQVLILWLDVHYQQTLAAEPREGKTDVDFLDRRLAKVRKRYVAALESLAKMDRILGLTPTAAHAE